MKDWKKVQGSQVERPAEFDATSSPTTVYQRRNIAQVEVEGADVGGRTAEQFVLQLEVGSARLHLEALR